MVSKSLLLVATAAGALAIAAPAAASPAVGHGTVTSGLMQRDSSDVIQLASLGLSIGTAEAVPDDQGDDNDDQGDDNDDQGDDGDGPDA